MMLSSIRFAIANPLTIVIGVAIGFFAAILSPALSEFFMEQYESLRPVIKDWKITGTVTEGDDITLTGTMRKTRDCLLVPPVIARDLSGRPYNVETPMWRAKDASEDLQSWGPWRVVRGAGVTLKFTMVYMCGGSRPTIVSVGKHEAVM